MVALVEFLGGIAPLIGLLTRLAELGLTLTMAGAIMLVHLNGGCFSPKVSSSRWRLPPPRWRWSLPAAGGFSLDRALARRRVL